MSASAESFTVESYMHFGQIVHLVRDPRAQYSSMKGRNEFKERFLNFTKTCSELLEDVEEASQLSK